MCNTEYAEDNQIKLYKVCSCGAAFHDCPDDREKAKGHITERSNPNHKWVYHGSRFLS